MQVDAQSVFIHPLIPQKIDQYPSGKEILLNLLERTFENAMDVTVCNLYAATLREYIDKSEPTKKAAISKLITSCCQERVKDLLKQQVPVQQQVPAQEIVQAQPKTKQKLIKKSINNKSTLFFTSPCNLEVLKTWIQIYFNSVQNVLQLYHQIFLMHRSFSYSKITAFETALTLVVDTTLNTLLPEFKKHIQQSKHHDLLQSDIKKLIKNLKIIQDDMDQLAPQIYAVNVSIMTAHGFLLYCILATLLGVSFEYGYRFLVPNSEKKGYSLATIIGIIGGGLAFSLLNYHQSRDYTERQEKLIAAVQALECIIPECQRKKSFKM